MSSLCGLLIGWLARYNGLVAEKEAPREAAETQAGVDGPTPRATQAPDELDAFVAQYKTHGALLEIMLTDSRPVYVEFSSAMATAIQGSRSVNLSETRGTLEYLQRIAEHNRILCDQAITVARLTPHGLIPNPGSTSGRAFLAKKYPRMCLVEGETLVLHNVPPYLLVYSESESAFTGFQPVQRTTNSPVSGSGTVTNVYGNMWNFNYSGTLTETRTVEVPYMIKSRTLYLNAYDRNGNIVSSRSMNTSSQTGGDASFAAGYNTGALLSLLWNNPKRLAANVLQDVQKDSMKYSKK